MMIKIISFRLGRSRFSVDVDKIVEVINPTEVQTVPDMPEFMDGIAKIRGEFVPLVDMRRRVEIESFPTKERAIIIKQGAEKVGILVDEVFGIFSIDEQSLRQPKVVFRGIKKKYISGIFGDGQEMTIVINIDNLLSSDEGIKLKETVRKAVKS